MNRILRKWIFVLLCLALCGAGLFGCGKNAPAPEESSSSVPTTETVTEEPETEELVTETTTAAPVWREEDPAELDRLLARKNQVFSEESVKITAEKGISPQAGARYTLMVYMTGSNLESSGAYATKDMYEMRYSGVDLSDVNVILYTGGAQSWKSAVPSSCNCVIDLAEKKNAGIVGRTEENADMGAPQTLAAFLNFAVEYFPAEHYGLIFWDHGGGPLWGYGNDELFDGDSLLPAEMVQAMDQTIFGSRRKLDLVGFDACLMGSFEMMTIWEKYARYFIGSEEVEPGDGWNYTFLEELNRTADAEVIGARILAEYEKHYAEQRTETYDPQVTLSCIRLDRVRQMSDALRKLFAKMSAGVKRGDYSRLQQLRSETKSFGDVETRSSGIYSYDLVDLGDFADQYGAMYPAESRAVRAALEEMVVSQVSNVPRASGATLYYPFRNKGQYEKLAETYRGIAFSTEYTGYLRDMTREWLYSKSRDWEIGELVREGNEWVCQLSEDQQKNLAGAYYTVIQHNENDPYKALLKHCRVYPDRSGVIRIPADPEIICLRTDLGDEYAWPVVQIESNELRETYRTVDTRLLADSNPFARILSSDNLPVSALFTIDRKTGEMKVHSLTETAATADLGGKSTVDLTPWETVYHFFHDNVPTNDVNGRMLPYDQWYTSSSSTWYALAGFDQDFSFYRSKASEANLSYTIQLVLEDTGGESYASELTPEEGPGYRAYTEKTGAGNLHYGIFSDHVSVISYEGADTEVTVPAQVEGLPVTEVAGGCFQQSVLGSGHTVPKLEKVVLPEGITQMGDNVFHNCRYLKEVVLPSSLEKLGECAFSGCSVLAEISLPENLRVLGKGCFDGCTALESVKLPPALTQIGEGLFMNCPALKEISGEAREGYRIAEHALYSGDGTVLIAYPADREGDVTVAAGTKRIGYGAFYESKVSRVTLPEGLTQIGGYAFFQCARIETPVLPDSLELIGPYAYGAGGYALSYRTIPEEQEVIRIGKNLREAAMTAFDLFSAKTFEVDPENETFTAVNGHLANKAGDTIRILATARQQLFRIPEGVTNFDCDLLEFVTCYDIFDAKPEIHLELPESLKTIYGTIRFQEERYVIHAPAGSLGQRFATRYGLSWDENPAQPYRIAQVPTEQGTIYARIYPEHAMILAYLGTDDSLAIPAEIEGVPVTVLGNGKEPIEPTRYTSYSDLNVDAEVFAEHKVKEILLPETLTTISTHAMQSNYLAGDGLVLPEGLRVIGDEALPGSAGQAALVLPGQLEHIGSGLPAAVREIPVSEHLRYISEKALDCSTRERAFVQTGENETYKVKEGWLYSADEKTLLCVPSCPFGGSLVIPEGVEVLGEGALRYARCGELTLPSTLKRIEDSGLYGCYYITELTLPEGLTYLGRYACGNLSSLTSIRIPDSVTQIEERAFSDCSALEEAELPAGLTFLGDLAFYNTKIHEVRLPDSLLSIGRDVFDNTRETMREGEGFVLHIGPQLREIGDNAFAWLPVTAFEVDPENPYYRAVDGLLCDKTGQLLWACPSGVQGEVHIGESVKVIRSYSFEACPGVTDVYVGAGVEMISTIAFPDAYWEDTGSERKYIKEYRITLHCPAGSYAETFALRYEMPHVTE